MGACVSAFIRLSLFRSKSLISPKETAIHRLHPELLSEIFLHCLPDDQYVTPDPLDAPLLVCRVCHYWREISLLTPKLWCSLNIEDPSHPPLTTLAEMWLDRSGQCHCQSGITSGLMTLLKSCCFATSIGGVTFNGTKLWLTRSTMCHRRTCKYPTHCFSKRSILTATMSLLLASE